MKERRSTARGLAAVVASGKMREQTGGSVHAEPARSQVRSDKQIQIVVCLHCLLVKVQNNVRERRSSR